MASIDARPGLFCMGALAWLRDAGMIVGPIGRELTPRGSAVFDQLEASGYRPTRADVLRFLELAVAVGDLTVETPSDFCGMVALIANWDRAKEIEIP